MNSPVYANAMKRPPATTETHSATEIIPTKAPTTGDGSDAATLRCSVY